MAILPRSLLWIAIAMGCACGSPRPALAGDAERLAQMAHEIDALESARRFVELEALAKQFVVISERIRAPLHIAIGLRAQGNALRGQQKLEAAEQVYRRALQFATQRDVKPELRGAADSIGANIYFRLGQVLQTQSKYQESEASFLAGVKLVEQSKGTDSIDLAPLLIDLASLYNDVARYDEALRLYDRAEKLIKSQPQPSQDLMTYVYHGRAVNCAYRCDFDQAIEQYRQELALLEKLYGADDPSCAEVMLSMSQSFKAQRRLDEAAALLMKAAPIFVRAHGPGNLKLASAYTTLAGVLLEQGRFADAETLLRQSLDVREKVLGESHPYVASTLGELALVYLFQDRDREALPLLERGIAILSQTYGPKSGKLSNSLTTLVQVQRNLNQLAAAEAAAHRLAEIYELTEPQSTYEAWHLLASVYRAQERYQNAIELYQRSLEACAKLSAKIPSARVEVKKAAIFKALALAYYSLNRKEESAEAHRRAIAIEEQCGVPPGVLAASLVTYAEVLYELGRPQEAQPLVERSMELFEQQRISFSGGDLERAEAFRKSSVVYEYAVRIHSESGDVAEVFRAMERGQARSLVDQIAAHGIDMFQGMPLPVADRLRRSLDSANVALAKVENQFDLLDREKSLGSEQYRSRQRQILSELQQRRADYAAVQAEIRNASPAYRLAVGQDFQVAGLAAAQEFARQNRALLLRYFAGYGSTFVVVISPDAEPTSQAISVPQALAKRLPASAGALSVDNLRHVLVNDANTGVLQRLRSANTAEAALALADPLSALYELLIPESTRSDIASGKYEQLVIIPDGPLAMLPFDALVVDAGVEPVYLLDVAPPIVYAPSFTLLHNLASRESAPLEQSGVAVLSVGDPSYGQAASADASSPASRSRGALAGLPPLPHSGLEVRWIAEVFRRNGVEVTTLLAQAATEAQVREALAQQKIIHFACHGLVDPSHGNLFGGLALTGIKTASPRPSDDGLLSLGEIYGLDLHTCELAILSACDTNYGPRQQGEGVWALSRGFLVAGSRRVVASNWLVDDEAGASLISYYCSLLAKQLGQGQAPEYAAALQEAKRWVKNQEKWSSPNFWANFVVVGPN